jgi:NADP-dependent 3-hydroxy acid dehydrogenase YdfG
VTQRYITKLNILISQRLTINEEIKFNVKTIVITGSTHGIGLGLTEAFLQAGCNVVISGRRQKTIDQLLSGLEKRYNPQRMYGFLCDVRDYEAVKALWTAALDHYGAIDIWINNAGVSHLMSAIWKLSQENVRQTIETNLLGTMYGSMVAMEGMLSQGYGGIYNMEGLGSSGRRVKGLAIYGTGKYALRYFNEALIDEAKDTPVIIGTISPGMVMTQLITRQYEGHPEEFEKAKWIFNLLAEKVETVTPWIAEKILNNRNSGIRIHWLTRYKVFMRLLLAPVYKRDIVRIK